MNSFFEHSFLDRVLGVSLLLRSSLTLRVASFIITLVRGEEMMKVKELVQLLNDCDPEMEAFFFSVTKSQGYKGIAEVTTVTPVYNKDGGIV